MSSEGLSLPIKPVIVTTTAVTAPNGIVSAPAYNFQDSKSSGMYFDTDNTTLRMSINGTSKLTISEATMTSDRADFKNIYFPGAVLASGYTPQTAILHNPLDNSYGLYLRSGYNDSRDLAAFSGFFYETKTTNDTVTALATIDTQFNDAQHIKAYVEAVNTGATLAGSFEIRGLYKNASGTVTRVGALSTSNITDSTWTATLAISGTQVLLNVTGAIGATVRWKAHVIVRDTRTSIISSE